MKYSQFQTAWMLLMLMTMTTAGAGQFEFAPPAVAGAPGTQTAPLLFIGFRGDGETSDAQVFYTFNGTLFTATAVSRNGGQCVVLGNEIRVLSPSGVSPLPSVRVNYCEVRFSISAAAPQAAYSLSIVDGSLECASFGMPSATCTAPSGNGVIRVGPNTPQAQFAYSPSANSTVILSDGLAEISADFVAGGFGAAIELHDCQIAPQSGAIFGPVAAAPQPLAFVSNLVGTGLLGLSCTQQLAETSGQLSCTETRNGTIPATRSWNLICPALPAVLIFENGFEDAALL
jgi:hypothetical protein